MDLIYEFSKSNFCYDDWFEKLNKRNIEIQVKNHELLKLKKSFSSFLLSFSILEKCLYLTFLAFLRYKMCNNKKTKLELFSKLDKQMYLLIVWF